MDQLISLIVYIACLGIGSILGYYARQSIARRNYRTIEAKLQKKVEKTRQEVEEITREAKQKAEEIVQAAKEEEDKRRQRLLKTEQVLLKRENILDTKLTGLETKEKEFQGKIKRLKEVKESLENLKQEALGNLERISELPKEEAKKELLTSIEKEFQQEILERIRKLEKAGIERFEVRAKEILTSAVQKCALSQAQEITTSTVSLPDEDVKGKIIGKEGRNIRTLEKLTGVEIIVDDTPQTVILSSFDPVRRYIAKISLEKLIQDGRIQPARIEEIVSKTKEEISSQIKDAGETAIYDTGILDLDPKLVQLLGRLKFRTSYGQNVLLHSIEVAHLAGSIASEVGADAKIAKKAGLLHDIGKAVDHQIQGSHVEIGIRILEKFGVEKKVIDAMKSHHEEYPYESPESVIVQTADAVSGSRPGARKDTLEDYLKRLGELEKVASSFSGVDKAWALQAGREIRVFVKPEELDDLAARKLAREIANRIQEELRYPGEIKVTVIRESRVIEYAK
ncbi:ribonuclease Y [Candidatus Parcubacteria bacterium]|nr:ribonuclease Y [Candidatus Parcubacteria bacterium]